ncbi:hypothetical protein Neosp_014935 [[Neocosmospora] mangrovei]
MDLPNIPISGGDDELIYHSAMSCSILFEKLLTQSTQDNGEHYATVRDYHLRFEHWVGFVGALADEQASLDNRLNHYPDVRDLVLQMLQMLYSNLHHEMIDDNIDKKDQSEPRIEAQTTAAPLVDEHPTSRLSSTLAIRAALDAAQEAIDRLQRLAAIIRRSSTSTLSSRVKTFAVKSDVAENTEFNRLIRLRIKGVLPGISESLAGQLLESISHRRHRLLYQRRHQKKLGRHRPAGPNHPLPQEPEREKQLVEPPLQQVISEPSRSKVASMASVYSKSQANSGTAHSTFDLSAFQHYQTQEDSVPSDNVTVTSVAQGYSYPSPPKPRDGSKHTRCDWCFEEILPFQLQASGWWSTALSEVQLTRKLTRNALPSLRKENICPLCNQDVLKTHVPTTEPDVKARKTSKSAKQSKKAGFGDLADNLSSEDEASTGQSNDLVEPELEPGKAIHDDLMVVRRQRIAIHVASHLKSLSFLSIRYMEGDSASIESEHAALGIDNDASDQERLSDIFPLSDGPLDFQDIPLDDRLGRDEGSGDQDILSDIHESPAISLDETSSYFSLDDSVSDTLDDNKLGLNSVSPVP